MCCLGKGDALNPGSGSLSVLMGQRFVVRLMFGWFRDLDLDPRSACDVVTAASSRIGTGISFSDGECLGYM